VSVPVSVPVYVHVEPGSQPPQLKPHPSRFVVIVESESSPKWQAEMSSWMVRVGCLYMMAWGVACSTWDDSVDAANLEGFEYGHIPEERFVMTTWHERDPLEEVFWFAKQNAHHPKVKLDRTVILHIGGKEKKHEFLRSYAEA